MKGGGEKGGGGGGGERGFGGKEREGGGGHTQYIIKKEDINKAKHTYPKAAVLHCLFKKKKPPRVFFY